MSKSREKQKLTPSVDDNRDGQDRADADRPAIQEGDTSERITGNVDLDLAIPCRWIPWTLAILVIVCLVLAAWVWLESFKRELAKSWVGGDQFPYSVASALRKDETPPVVQAVHPARIESNVFVSGP